MTCFQPADTQRVSLFISNLLRLLSVYCGEPSKGSGGKNIPAFKPAPARKGSE
jgi:hypothetical protein